MSQVRNSWRMVGFRNIILLIVPHNLGTNNLIVDTNTLYVDAASNEVGIGTATPGAKLHIVGIVKFPTVGAGATGKD